MGFIVCNDFCDLYSQLVYRQHEWNHIFMDYCHFVALDYDSKTRSIGLNPAKCVDWLAVMVVFRNEHRGFWSRSN